MIKTYLLLFLSIMGFSHANFGQTNLKFQPLLNGSPVVLNDSTNEILITALKLYISQIEFAKDNQSVWKEKDSYHLLDAENPSSFLIETSAPTSLDYNQLKFTLGIDSATHEAGVMGGDLDPTKGMYWSWQSGYINFKIEGQHPKSLAEKNEFQYHLGGYKNGFSSARRITLNIRSESSITIYFELSELLKFALNEGKSHIMSPGTLAQRLARIASSNFSSNVK